MQRRLALLGGGLHNQLLALRLVSEHAELQVVIWEKESRLPRDKMISCHLTDIPPEWTELLAPFWLKRWERYMVRFPDREQVIPLGYQTLDLGALADHLTEFSRRFPNQLELRTNKHLQPHSKEIVEGGYDLVVDTRAAQPLNQPAGVQQFLGRVFELDKPHGLQDPIVMDACVPQINGFCFVYSLPLTDTTILIEDTRLLAAAESEEAFEDGLQQYIKGFLPEAMGARVLHEERGQIPIPLVNFQTFARNRKSGKAGLLHLGSHNGFFHPTTGYSLPLALRNAQMIASKLNPMNTRNSMQLSQADFDTRSWDNAWGVALVFNQFLLWGFEAHKAHHAFSYFYGLPLWFIARFYKANLQYRDLHVILMRRPPKTFHLLRFVRRRIRHWWSSVHERCDWPKNLKFIKK